MSQAITSFRNEYRFLSNFWPVDVILDDEVYPSVEHAYQAAKTLNEGERAWIRGADKPSIAKRRGRQVSKRDDWEGVKLEVMRDLLRQKFYNPPLRDRLLATGYAELMEGNTWGDRFWGVAHDSLDGDNHLGRLLMLIREEVR